MMRRPTLLALLVAAALAPGCSPPPLEGALGELPVVYPEQRSRVAFVVRERDLIPEGIAHDPVGGSFYLGSFRKSKILELRPDGSTSELVSPHERGLQAVMGMRVDAERRRLWAATGTAPHMEDYRPEADQVTGLLGFDLSGEGETFRLLRPKSSLTDVVNDVAIDAEGTVYASGFGGGAVYRLEGGRLRELWRFEEGHRPNGLDLSDDGSHLFVSTGKTIFGMGLESAEVFRLQVPEGENLAGIDGLSWYRDGLVAVQSKRRFGEAGTRIVRLVLSQDRRQVEELRVLEEDHPFHDQPTTGVVVGDRFYYIANSQFPRFDRNYSLAPLRGLADVIILELSLD